MSWRERVAVREVWVKSLWGEEEIELCDVGLREVRDCLREWVGRGSSERVMGWR